MSRYFLKARNFFLAHKFLSIFLIVIIFGVGLLSYKKINSTAADTRYLTTKVSKGTLISSVSGSGQVSSLSQIDLKPKVSGDVIYIGTENGKKVSAGFLIAEVDPKDAQKALRDAQTSLESAKLSLEKTKLQNSSENLNSDLNKTYQEGFNTVSSSFLDLPSIIDGLDSLLNERNLSDNSASISGKTARNFRDAAETSYYTAKTSFDKTRNNYRLMNSNSSNSEIENIINETYKTTSLVADTIKNYITYVNFMAEDQNDSSIFSTEQSTLSTYSNTISSDLSSLLSAKTNINNAKDTVPSASLDLQSAELSVEQKENALQDAKDKLSDYFIRAPFPGIIANMNLKKSDSVSGSTVVATLITDKQIAEISMNEVDVAKIKIGEKATLTFDAVPDLTISGSVAEIDSIGTVSQGVVTYNVKISFDTQDERVKPGMSVNAAIITDIKQGVLLVPNSAIKSQNGTNYIEMFSGILPLPADGMIGSISKIPPEKIPVEVGLSNDSETEIISGLIEGDEIVSRTILPTNTTKSAAAPSLFGSPATGNRTGGGNAGRTGSTIGR